MQMIKSRYFRDHKLIVKYNTSSRLQTEIRRRHFNLINDVKQKLNDFCERSLKLTDYGTSVTIALVRQNDKTFFHRLLSK